MQWIGLNKILPKIKIKSKPNQCIFTKEDSTILDENTN